MQNAFRITTNIRTLSYIMPIWNMLVESLESVKRAHCLIKKVTPKDPMPHFEKVTQITAHCLRLNLTLARRIPHVKIVP
jgi:hypothetical protein